VDDRHTDAWPFARRLCATMFSSTRKSKRNKKLLKNIDNDVRWPLLLLVLCPDLTPSESRELTFALTHLSHARTHTV
jgi:hypothetical protein